MAGKGEKSGRKGRFGKSGVRLEMGKVIMSDWRRKERCVG